MSEELGKIEKPLAERFKKSRKLCFVPLLYAGKESPSDYLEKSDRYWSQVEAQLSELELKLGQVVRIYHELISASGEEGVKVIKDLNDRSYHIVKSQAEKGAMVEAAEDSEVLTEFMDWSRCLSIGLQNQKVFTSVYESYTAASKERNELIARRIDETLKADEIGVLFMREGHRIQFPADVEVFYVAPPALDEIHRWLRDREARFSREEGSAEGEKKD